MPVADRDDSSSVSTTLVSPDDVAGRFHPGRPVGHNLEPLTRWRVVTRHASVAREVARILGTNDCVPLAAGGGLWEVATVSSRVRIVVCRMDRTGIAFCLAGAVRLGEFCFSSGSWGLAHSAAELKRLHAASGARMLGVLALAKVVFTTRCGRSVLYARPVLEVTRPPQSAPGQRF